MWRNRLRSGGWRQRAPGATWRAEQPDPARPLEQPAARHGGDRLRRHLPAGPADAGHSRRRAHQPLPLPGTPAAAVLRTAEPVLVGTVDALRSRVRVVRLRAALAQCHAHPRTQVFWTLRDMRCTKHAPCLCTHCILLETNASFCVSLKLIFQNAHTAHAQ